MKFVEYTIVIYAAITSPISILSKRDMRELAPTICPLHAWHAWHPVPCLR